MLWLPSEKLDEGIFPRVGLEITMGSDLKSLVYYRYYRRTSMADDSGTSSEVMPCKLATKSSKLLTMNESGETDNNILGCSYNPLITHRTAGDLQEGRARFWCSEGQCFWSEEQTPVCIRALAQ